MACASTKILAQRLESALNSKASGPRDELGRVIMDIVRSQMKFVIFNKRMISEEDLLQVGAIAAWKAVNTMNRRQVKDRGNAKQYYLAISALREMRRIASNAEKNKTEVLLESLDAHATTQTHVYRNNHWKLRPVSNPEAVGEVRSIINHLIKQAEAYDDPLLAGQPGESTASIITRTLLMARCRLTGEPIRA